MLLHQRTRENPHKLFQHELPCQGPIPNGAEQLTASTGRGALLVAVEHWPKTQRRLPVGLWPRVPKQRATRALPHPRNDKARP
jgi:hypothetical protein